MIEGNVGVIRKLAREAYKLNEDEILDKIAGLKKWPYGPNIRRIVPVDLSMKRLVKVELAELVYLGFVLLIEIEDMRWIPVRTLDFMTGYDSDHDIEIAKNDVELARLLKGNDAPIDQIL